MKMIFFILLCSLINSDPVNAQTDNLPKEIAEQFYMQYPYATELNCSVEGATAIVHFIMKKEKYKAVYKRAVWEYTLMDFNFDRLSEKVKEGFRRSRFAQQDVESVDIVYVPSGFETYRFKLKKTVDNKKYHYFNESGRLLHNPPFQD
jgi:hypothetical protein